MVIGTLEETYNGIKKRTHPITFRVAESLLYDLRMVAERSNVSLNTLVNKLFAEFLDWHCNAPMAGFIPVRRRLVTELMEKLSEDDIMHMAEYMANETKDVVLLLRNRYDIASALDVLETWLRICGYPYRYRDHDGIRSYVIQHDMGKKWSLYIAAHFQFVAKEMGCVKIEFDITENTLAFKIDVSAKLSNSLFTDQF